MKHERLVAPYVLQASDTYWRKVLRDKVKNNGSIRQKTGRGGMFCQYKETRQLPTEPTLCGALITRRFDL